MNRSIITITDEGAIIVPGRARMTIGEIADLLGIYYQTAKRHIRAIEKAGIADGDYRMTCIAEGVNVRPMFYGLDMITAVAFRAEGHRASVFRRWLMERAAQTATKFQTSVTMIIPERGDRLPN